MESSSERVISLSPKEKKRCFWINVVSLVLFFSLFLILVANRLRSLPLVEKTFIYLLSSTAGVTFMLLAIFTFTALYVVSVVYIKRGVKRFVDQFPEYHVTESGFWVILPPDGREYYNWHTLRGVFLIENRLFARLTFDSGVEVKIGILGDKFLKAVSEIGGSDNLINKEIRSWNMATSEHRTLFWKKFWKAFFLINLVFSLGLVAVVAVEIYESVGAASLGPPSVASSTAIPGVFLLCLSAVLSFGLHGEEYRRSRPLSF